MKKLLLAVVVTGLAASPLVAGHANPWATDEDVLQMQFHDENLAQSEETPGEDEMRGVMVRSAHGKLGTTGRGLAERGASAGHGASTGGGHGGFSGGRSH